MRGNVLALAALAALCATSALASPVGLWRAKDGAQIRIAACGPALCGRIAKARVDPATGRPALDKHSGRPLTGLEILSGLRPEAPGRWAGRLYNEDDGQLYAGRLLELGPSRIRIEGCSLGICGGEELARIR
jgi:uncharacterized protein (DUF2147 family)